MTITAVILAGGQSRRMGRNKALLSVGGVPVIEKLVKELSYVTDTVLIAGGPRETYSYLEAEIVSDTFPGAGPLAGLHAGLKAAGTTWTVFVACDMPFASREAVRWLADRTLLAEKEGKEAVIPVIEGREQPLLAAYRRSVLPGLEETLREGRLKLTRWTEGLKADYTDGAAMASAAGIPAERIPFNMNRPEDYRQALTWTDVPPRGEV
ncbi:MULTISPECIES: molybdenum cofactor guanylyltransferase [Paenibacillus]|uniref:molybdenum cofactor guanylyltransferase n=1 Tax=Paenibacillus TaxID=44249 RepID=UPI002FDF83B1